MHLNPCGVITLMTDFGTSDHFVGVMKGVILNISPQARIVDITHAVPPQDIHGAAFLINSAYRYFPAGAIHIVVVDPGVGSCRRGIVCQTDTAYFVCPDNGVLSHILDNNTTPRVVALDNAAYWLSEISNTFHGRDIFRSRGSPLVMWDFAQSIWECGKQLGAIAHPHASSEDDDDCRKRNLGRSLREPDYECYA